MRIAAREQRCAFTIGVLASIIFAAAAVGAAYVLSAVVSRLAAPVFRGSPLHPAAVAAAVGIVVSVSVLKIAATMVRRTAVGYQQFGLAADYRTRILHRYLDLPYAWQLRQSSGALLSTASSDVNATWSLVAGLPLAVGALAVCAIATVAMLITDPALTAVCVSVFPILVMVNIVSSRRLVPHLTEMQQLRAELAGIASENVDGAHVVRALGRADAEVARFDAAARRLFDASMRAARVRSFFNPLTDGLPFFGSLALLLVGVLRMKQGAIGIEQLLSATLLFSGIAFPLAGLGWMLGLLPSSVVGWERLRLVLDLPVPAVVHTTDHAGSGPGQLHVESVTYRYDGNRTAVDDVRLTVGPGRTVAIAGITGSGKSTLARLIAGLVAPDEGRVRLDGTLTTAFHPGERSQHIGYVPQETFLFAGTVRENLVLDHENGFTDEELWTALRTARAAEFVAALNGGLDGEVGERGTKLSGGQRQRIALARAFVRRPQLLVLDDATSGLDPAVESAVVNGLREAFPATTVVITDRYESLAAADEVVFLDAGRLVARGTHETLLATDHDYARFVLAHGGHR